MKYFRLIEDIPTRSPLGFGLGGARWNYSGVPIIYLSNFSSIAINEMISIKGSTVAKSNWKICTLEIADPIPELKLSDIPKDWNIRPASKSTKDIGTLWANEMKSVCLKVPSARLNLTAYSDEHNLLVNPLHPDFRKVVNYLNSEDFNFQLNDVIISK
ncbi:RES family NAD+ phosphorylase [Spongiimicrobium sp. 2-473A-2-J]|uniref:RES family NAD+ phosphorylase n=1 Tax=Eudoraea algarum TaxID=3417568 RepID=UPI003D36DD4A